MSDNTLRVRLDDAHWQMLLELCQNLDRDTPDMVRKMIRDAHAQLGKGKEMATKIQQTQQNIAKARGGCIAVRVYDVNGSGHIEAEIDPAAAKYCPCEFCKAGDLTTSQ